jgi:cellulose synthase operon protein C
MVQSANVNDLPNEPDGPSRKENRRLILNARFLLSTAMVAVIFGAAGYAWHAWQVVRTSNAYLDEADRLEKDGKYAEASDYVFRYLQLHPNDASAKAKLAKTFDLGAKPAEKTRAIDLYYQAIGVASSEVEPELRLRVAELNLEAGRFANAETEARTLLERDGRNPAANRLLALALYGQFSSGILAVKNQDYSIVGNAFEDALKLNPGDIRLSSELARIYRTQEKLLRAKTRSLPASERAKTADQLMEAMVLKHGTESEALIDRHLYRAQFNLPEAGMDLETAIKHSPDDLKVQLAAAAWARRQSEAAREKEDPKEARNQGQRACEHYQKAIQIAPAEEQSYLGLGEAQWAQEEPDRAIATWQDGLKQCGKANFRLNSCLAQALIAKGRLDQAEEPLNLLNRSLGEMDPSLPRNIKLPLEHTVRLLRGKWLAQKGKYREAIPFLQEVALGPKGDVTELSRKIQASVLLGSAYASLKRWDQAAEAYGQASSLQPDKAEIHLAAGDAWAAAGRSAAAASHYEQALALADSPKTRFVLASARYQQQMKLPPLERDWKPFEMALAAAKKASTKPQADSWQLSLLEAEYLAARAKEKNQAEQGRRDALDALRRAEKDFPQAAGLMERAVSLYERLGSPEDADRALEQFEKLADKPAQSWLLRSRLCVWRKQYDKALQAVNAGLKKLPAEDQTALRLELVVIAMQTNRQDEAQRQLLELHRKDPTNVSHVKLLADLALGANNGEELARWKKKLAELEGADGPDVQYYEARRLIDEAKDAKDPKLSLAAEIQARLAAQRPTWPATHLLRALISDRRGKVNEAIDAFQEALRMGEQRPIVIERLIVLLGQTGRVQEADRLLALLQERVGESEGLASLELAIATKQGQMDRALRLAQQEVERRPNDPMALIPLGQLLFVANRLPEAEEVLQKAVRSAPAEAKAWTELRDFYLQSKQIDRAKETLRKLAANEKIDKLKRALMLAQSYELLGDRDQAERNYREAAGLAPDDQAMEIRLAGMLYRSGKAEDLDAAEKILSAVLEKTPKSGLARRAMAAVLAGQGGDENWQKALRLLEQSDAASDDSNPDVRLQSLLLIRRGGEDNRRKAIQLLEKLTADADNASDQDRFLLAWLYDFEGQSQAADKQYLTLASRSNPNLRHVAAYVGFSLDQGNPDQAARWLEKLEKAAPEKLETVALKSRWLQARREGAKIEPLVEPVAEKLMKACAGDTKRESNLALTIGNLYSSVQCHAAAARWYARLRELSPEGPADAHLAISLARQNRTEEAIRICLAGAKTDMSPRTALTLANVLLSGQPADKDFQLAEPMLAEALKNHKDNADLLVSIANVRTIQQRFDEALALNRQALELNPKHVLALNNQATLLAETPARRREALDYIDRAIQEGGPQSMMLDTKGTIFLYDGKAREAVSLLEKAVSGAKSAHQDPRCRFHLALAYDRVGEKQKALDALKKARAEGLSDQNLTPTDKNMLGELERKAQP